MLIIFPESIESIIPHLSLVEENSISPKILMGHYHKINSTHRIKNTTIKQWHSHTHWSYIYLGELTKVNTLNIKELPLSIMDNNNT